MSIRNHLDKIGIVGATFAALCCLGIPAILSVVAALGLGFVVNDAVLMPLLLISIVILAWGLIDGWRRHQNPAALVIGIIAGLMLYGSAFLLRSTAFAYVSIAGLIGASVLNVLSARRLHAAH
jgi:mercuric ion transport protein